MKRILTLLIIASTLSFANFFQEEDKQLHMGISVFVGMAGNALAKQEYGLSDNEAWWAGLISALVVGAIKEATDEKFDWQDLAADGIGGAIGTTFTYTIYKW